MEKKLTAGDVAEHYGCARRTVLRARERAGVGEKVGTQWIFSARDLHALGRHIYGRPGNPAFVAGNYYGQPPPKD